MNENTIKSTVYVQGISTEMNNQMLSALFQSQVGPVVSAFVYPNPTRHPLCYGFVCFTQVEDAQRAVLEMNDFWEPITQCRLTVRPYKPKGQQWQQQGWLQPQNELFPIFSGTTPPIWQRIQVRDAAKGQSSSSAPNWGDELSVLPMELDESDDESVVLNTPEKRPPSQQQVNTRPIADRIHVVKNEASAAPSNKSQANELGNNTPIAVREEMKKQKSGKNTQLEAILARTDPDNTRITVKGIDAAIDNGVVRAHCSQRQCKNERTSSASASSPKPVLSAKWVADKLGGCTNKRCNGALLDAMRARRELDALRSQAAAREAQHRAELTKMRGRLETQDNLIASLWRRLEEAVNANESPSTSSSRNAMTQTVASPPVGSTAPELKIKCETDAQDGFAQ